MSSGIGNTNQPVCMRGVNNLYRMGIKMANINGMIIMIGNQDNQFPSFSIYKYLFFQ